MTWKKFLFSKLGLVFLLAIFAGTVYLLAGEIHKRYAIESEIAELRSQISEAEQTSADLFNVIDYFRSASFQERELRSKLNLQKPGEHVVVLPADVSDVPNVSGGQVVASIAEEQSWLQWWDYFFKTQ